VLEAGDALAKKAIDAKHEKELEKVAPAKVVHVDAPEAKPDVSEGVDSATSLANDLAGLKERAAEQKAEKLEDKKRHEQRKLKVQAIKDKRQARNKEVPGQNKTKRRAMNLDKLVKLTNEIKQTALIQKQAPVETHSTLEAHAEKLEEAQKEVDTMPKNHKKLPATHAAPSVEEKEGKAPEPSKQAENKKFAGGAVGHPENTDHLKNIAQAVGHLSEETGPPPAAVKEVQDVLNKAQAMTAASKDGTAAAPVPQFVADPHKAKLRAKKFKNKMDNHVDEMHHALHEHEKAVDTKKHLEKIAKEREAEEEQRQKWELEQARLEQLKAQAEALEHEKKEKEQQQAIENRTASEAAHRVDDPQAEFRAQEEARKPQTPVPRSGASSIHYCALVFVTVAAYLV